MALWIVPFTDMMEINDNFVFRCTDMLGSNNSLVVPYTNMFGINDASVFSLLKYDRN